MNENMKYLRKTFKWVKSLKPIDTSKPEAVIKYFEISLNIFKLVRT